MTKIIKNLANVVLYAGDNLTLTAQRAGNGDWIDPNLNTGNASILDVADLPSDWIGGGYTHTNGVWAQTPQGVAYAQSLSQAAADAVRIAGLDSSILTDAKLAAVKTATNAQIDTWLTNNVTNLAQARDLLGTILKVIIRRVL